MPEEDELEEALAILIEPSMETLDLCSQWWTPVTRSTELEFPHSWGSGEGLASDVELIRTGRESAPWCGWEQPTTVDRFPAAPLGGACEESRIPLCVHSVQSPLSVTRSSNLSKDHEQHYLLEMHQYNSVLEPSSSNVSSTDTEVNDIAIDRSGMDMQPVQTNVKEVSYPSVQGRLRLHKRFWLEELNAPYFA